MRVPIGWLAEHVDIPAGTPVEDLDTAFVRLGLEVEEVHRPAEVTGPLVVGRVLEIEELTGYKKPIRYCQVDVGEQQPRGIVCGATNFAVGDSVVVALPGAVLPGGFGIAARKTYDHVSDGMICSVRELGVGEDHAGILVLGDDAPAPGTPAGPVVGLDDVVIELAITPDRGYCLSLRGIAREMGTGLGVEWRDPGALTPPAWSGEPAWPVSVEDADRCDRFSMVALEGLDPTAPSPWWMRRRLAQSSVRSISLAVDVTNYVMLELGQPMHAFDRDRVRGPIVVRRAREGERLTTLDGVERALSSDDLLITDDSGPIGLAAVMGGASTEIGDGTSTVLLEAAHWEPTGVARTARRHRLPSEAAKRFERGVDPEMTVAALVRAAALLAEYGGARVVGTPVDVDTRGPRPTIPLDPARPGRVAGVPYPPAQVTELLGTVGCTVEGDSDRLTVTPPSWRPDLTDPADLVEEVVRLAGYDEVPSVLPTAPPGRGLTERQRRRRAVGRVLAEFGYVEAPSFPFVGTAALDALGLAEDDPRRQVVLVRNPLSEEEPALRTTLLPGLLAALARNLSRGIRDVALFEHGAVFPGGERSAAPLPGVDRRPDDETLAALLGAVPEQPWHVAVALSGHREPRGWWGQGRPAVWADAVQAARRVAEAAGVELTVRAGERAPWHPGRCAELLVDGRVVGHAGELHPRVCAALDLPARTAVMELDVDALPPASVPVGPHLSSFPPVFVDLAFVLNAAVPAAAVEESIREAAGELLEAVRLFDVYTGPQVGEGRRSLAWSLTLRAPDRTLSGEEAAEVRRRVVAFVEEAQQAELRG
ncbi:phenylalanine--tRNA ligase subunit beta [Geodermatophilus obscurus]|uniref:Phenylalanine--tRNA ligase beta subunit n=1 Tax=Geodermatophilus obscurus (strain ATCC 25078 / DSM 43160 / JCM 3152 / CCUG 61914 / KCC A-0152 / KCTC 9177 / NBRC 13315 / NRRL B-3577 / G-20) TaxID=526225 RepID=D2S8R1_GEOOG|nr:phenylalanine--tRNA ligase subunit beta [Geodermatophilus obscurus]ADB75642.1 phenylalanyl-tRNA synthetase, beta subunit [Geodermatophilus obscurus DSM 43160]